jgi:hypothetical protein
MSSTTMTKRGKRRGRLERTELVEAKDHEQHHDDEECGARGDTTGARGQSAGGAPLLALARLCGTSAERQ